MRYHEMDGERVLALLSSQKCGLTQKEAQRRLKADGENVLREKKKKGALALFFEQFKDFMTVLLIIAAVISAVLAFITGDRQEVVDTAILFMIILLNSVVGFVQQYRADNAIAKMKNLSASRAKVLRDGKEAEIDSSEIVKGDVLLFCEGDKITADCRILECNGLCVVESALTGESESVEKSKDSLSGELPLAERKNMLYSSTFAVRGEATAVAVATGMETEIGKIADMMEESQTPPTPLEKALEKLGKVISCTVVGIAAFIFVFGAFFRNVGILPNFMSSIAVAVAAIPEGLPAVVTILMALGVQKMAKHRAIVRKLQAVETLGACNTVCTDKTGTLTQNKMTVRRIYDFGNGDSVFACMEFCNTVRGEYGSYTGDPTEIALKNYVHDACPHLPRGERLDMKPFDSERKMMSVAVRSSYGDTVYVKGGADVLMRKCTHMMRNGKVQPLTGADEKQISGYCAVMAQKALRVLGFALRPYDGAILEEDLVFIGVCGMIDPPKEGVEAAVAECKDAGIAMVMITGDRKDTALAIASDLGVTDDPRAVMTGDELDALPEEESIEHIRVFARVNPEHKNKIVQRLQKRGKTVAMTGDGVNDAPSIRSADIGIAMGSGTDVTKGAADIVIADDNFATIVTAIAEGRRIFANIRKTIAFFLATNLGEVLSVLIVTLFFSKYAFLSSTQLLWLNLITDSFPVIALGVEKAERDIMRRPPARAEKEIFSFSFFVPVVLFGILQTIAVLGVFCYTLQVYGNETALTAAFFTMSFAELFYAFCVRTERVSVFGKEFFGNKVLLITVFCGILANVLLCPFAGVRAAFRIVPLDWRCWLLVVGAAFSVLPMGELYKCALRISDRRRKRKELP